jgi:predicted HNH restriction endonuclease
MREEAVKKHLEKLNKLKDEINSSNGYYKLEVKQQNRKNENIGLSGANGHLGVAPIKDGYRISLCGKSLENKMYIFMRDLLGKECDGYGQRNARLGKKDQPFWKTSDFEKVRSAAYYYASNAQSSDEMSEEETNEDLQTATVYPDELDKSETLFEGIKKTVLVNSYERNQVARNKCIKYYGLQCVVCGFDFEKVYGDIGKGFIHVHHLTQLSDIGQGYEVNSINDLRPVCPNCHAMLHKKNPPYTIDELKSHRIG